MFILATSTETMPSRFDVDARKRATYLPYEIPVSGNKAEALHMRYRMALYVPGPIDDGRGAELLQTQVTPDAVLQALRKASGGSRPRPRVEVMQGS